MKTITTALIASAAVLVAALPAAAIPTSTMIGNGTVSSADNFTPTVDVSRDPSTFTANYGTTFQTSATGGFAGASGHNGTLNGMLSFSDTVGVTIPQMVADFFVFDDGNKGTFNFSASSVLTRSFNNNPNITTSASLYLLGNTVDAFQGKTSTPTSLTVTFNSTGGSAYSSSLTLAVPPAPLDVPEPMSLALLGGFLVIAGLIRHRA